VTNLAHDGAPARNASRGGRVAGATANQVVLAWMLQSDPSVVPILGVSSVAQLDECLAAIDLELGPELMEQLDTLRLPAE